MREKLFAHLAPDIFKRVLKSLETNQEIVVEKDIIRCTSHSLELSANDKLLREQLLNIYKKAQFEVPKLENALSDVTRNTKTELVYARKIFQLLLNSGEIVKVTEDFYFESSAIEYLTKQLKDFAAASSDKLIDVAKFKDIAGISRKYAIPLLEYLDREK